MATNQSSLDSLLGQLSGSLSLQDAADAVKTLIKIVQNVMDHPGDEHYRQLPTTNKAFNSKVWKHLAAQEFMLAIGWVKIDGAVVLPSDDLLPDALVALVKVKSELENHKRTESSQQHSSSQPSAAHSSESDSYQQRMKQMREQMKQVELEKKRIAEQIKADRRETTQRRAQASHATSLAFGSRMTTFSDIGVDLNKGGG